MKTCLSGILKENFDHRLLDVAENFQTAFIFEDEAIVILMKEINILKDLFDEYHVIGYLNSIAETSIERLENEMELSAKRFQTLKDEFHEFGQKISRQ